MKILIYTDSRGNFLPSKDINLSWPKLLEKQFPEHEFVINSYCYTSTTLSKLVEFADQIQPDMIISQIGMIEWTPRMYLQAFYAWQELPEEFKKISYIKQLNQDLSVKEIFFPEDLFTYKYPHLRTDIYDSLLCMNDFFVYSLTYLNKYNHYAILPTVTEINKIYPTGFLEKMKKDLTQYCEKIIILPDELEKFDGEHYTEEGHQIIAQLVSERIS